MQWKVLGRQRGEKENLQRQQHLLVAALGSVAFFRIPPCFSLLMDTMKEWGSVGSVLKIPFATETTHGAPFPVPSLSQMQLWLQGFLV